jgi:protein tyrosine phosphatase (PTP) superfamily phosphohydrolase (DUF442 family)
MIKFDVPMFHICTSNLDITGTKYNYMLQVMVKFDVPMFHICTSNLVITGTKYNYMLQVMAKFDVPMFHICTSNLAITGTKYNYMLQVMAKFDVPMFHICTSNLAITLRLIIIIIIILKNIRQINLIYNKIKLMIKSSKDTILYICKYMELHDMFNYRLFYKLNQDISSLAESFPNFTNLRLVNQNI